MGLGEDSRQVRDVFETGVQDVFGTISRRDPGRFRIGLGWVRDRFCQPGWVVGEASAAWGKTLKFCLPSGPQSRRHRQKFQNVGRIVAVLKSISYN